MTEEKIFAEMVKKDRESVKEHPRVSIVRGVDPKERTEKGINLIGGISSFISPGDVVFVKPNFVYPLPPPATTDIKTIRAVVRLAKDAGAKRVIVGDSPSSASKRAKGLSSAQVFETLGIDKAVREAGGEALYLDDDEVVQILIPDAVICKTLKVYRSFVEADKIISMPVMKTHFLTDVTLGLKCLYGIVGFEDRKNYHRDDIHQKLSDIGLKFRPALTVIDGGICMEGFGPSAGSPVQMNLTIASGDVLAADAVGAAVMGYDSQFIDHLRIAAMAGIGVIDLKSIRVEGESIESCKREFVKPDLRLGGVWRNVSVIEGGVCRECRARARWALDDLQSSGLLARIPHLTVILGVTPYIPPPADLKGLTLVVGDCAVYAAGNLRRFLPKDKGIFVDGCPSDLTSRVVTGLVRDIFERSGKTSHG